MFQRVLALGLVFLGVTGCGDVSLPVGNTQTEPAPFALSDDKVKRRPLAATMAAGAWSVRADVVGFQTARDLVFTECGILGCAPTRPNTQTVASYTRIRIDPNLGFAVLSPLVGERRSHFKSEIVKEGVHLCLKNLRKCSGPDCQSVSGKVMPERCVLPVEERLVSDMKGPAQVRNRRWLKLVVTDGDRRPIALSAGRRLDL